MQLTQVLYYARNHINHIIYKEHTIYGLNNITPMYPLIKTTH